MRQFKSPAIHQTPLYRATAAYRGMQARSNNKNGKNPTYTNVDLRMTLEQWLAWALPKYEQFIAANLGTSPNAARKGDAGHYEIGNIEIITNIENRSHMAKPGQLRPDGTKRCSCCKEIKSSTSFNRNKSQRDGYSHACVSCNKRRMREWRAKKNGHS